MIAMLFILPSTLQKTWLTFNANKIEKDVPMQEQHIQNSRITVL